MDADTLPLACIVLAILTLYVLIGSEFAEGYGNRRVPLRAFARLPPVKPGRPVPWFPLLLVVATVGIVHLALLYALFDAAAAPATRLVGATGTVVPVAWLLYLYRLPRS